MGITNTQALLTLVLSLLTVGEDIFHGGKMDPTKLGELLLIVPQVSPALSGISSIPKELKELTEPEAASLVGEVVSKLGITDAHAVSVINASLQFASAAYSLYSAVKAPTPVAAA